MTDTTDAPGVTTGEPADLLALTDSTPMALLLDRWLEESLAEVGDRPDDAEQADRMLWVLRRVRQRIAEVEYTASMRKAQIDTWAAEQREQLDARMDYITAGLEQWAHAERERTGRQTVKLPAGTLKLTARRQSVVIEEPRSEETVGAVGALVPDAVVTKLEVQATPLRTKGIQAGDPIEGYENPEGYVAHTAVLPSEDTDGHGGFVEVPRVAVLVPADGREGFSFKVDTR